VSEQDLRGVCDECGQPFVISAAEQRHRAIRPGQPTRLCGRCLIAAAHERRFLATARPDSRRSV
jgi:hypothetical protein